MNVFSDESDPVTEADGFFAYVTFDTEDWIDTVEGWFPANSNGPPRPEAWLYGSAEDALAAAVAFVGEYGR